METFNLKENGLKTLFSKFPFRTRRTFATITNIILKCKLTQNKY